MASDNEKENEETIQVCTTTDEPTNRLLVVKAISLCSLALHSAVLSTSTRYARTRPGPMFISSTAVFMAEVLKLATAILIHFHNEEYSLTKTATSLHDTIIRQWKDTLKVGVPALLYVIQNNCYYLALSNMDAATFQVLAQMKIFVTAFCAFIIMGQTLQILQWVSLCILACGLVLAQLSSSSSSVLIENVEQNVALGLFATFAASFLSGFAGVYFEKMLKHAEVSLWLRNIQLSVLSLPLSLISCLVSDHSDILDRGFFVGYDLYVWCVICLVAFGGFAVAASVKYADNILKNFATSIGIIGACVLSVYLFHNVLHEEFVLGSALVIFSVFLYNRQAGKK